MKITENTKEFVCHYGHRFLGKDIKLVPFRNESRELLGKVLFISSDDHEAFIGGRPKDGYLMACPQCNIIQLGGFVCPADLLIDKTKVDDTKRNIALQL